MDIAVQVGWFIALLIAPAYLMKYLGGTKTLWAAFAVSFLLCLWIVPMTILRAFHRYHDFMTLRALLVPAIFSVQAAIYGMACWTVWKRKPSARLTGKKKGGSAVCGTQESDRTTAAALTQNEVCS